MNLSGSFIYTQGAQGILRLDLATGASTSVLPPLDKAWLSAATVSPDGKTIVIAYAPPPQGDDVQLGYTGLYEISSDGTETTPRPLLERVDPQESYFTPAFTSDGKYLYFAHFIPIRDPSGNTFKYTVERIVYPDGEPEVLVENAIWPRPSPDGTKLAFLKFDVENFVQELYLSDLDGQNGKPVLPPGEFPSVDAQFFSSDGTTLIFNATGQGQSPALAWLDWLMGVQIAEAHNVPSDWWSITLGGSSPVRLTELYDTGMYGSFSPDGAHIGFISASGVYVMDPDGANVTPIVPIDALGTLEWVP
jgi:Tol biopolymer transport system component